MKDLDAIIEGVVSKKKSSISQYLNETLEMISDAAKSIGYKVLKVNYVESPEDEDRAIVKLRLTKRFSMKVQVFDVDDITIEIPPQISEMIDVSNYSSIKPNNLSKDKAASLKKYKQAPAIGAAIARLEEIWMRLKEHRIASHVKDIM